MSNVNEDQVHPRLAWIIKWPDFDGYGFNLHGEKSKPGQYIGKVDKDSPAEWAGLKANDRIIEVNGTNISNENHKQVVMRIKAIPNETKLLVLDEKADQYYKNLNVVVHGNMPNVVTCKTPVPRPATLNNAAIASNNGSTNGLDHESNGTGTHSDEDNHDRASHVSDSGSGSSLPSKNNSLTKKDSRNGFSMSEEDEKSMSELSPSPTPPGSSASPSPTPILSGLSISNGKSKSSNGALNLNMTASEMRAKLAAQKKEKLDVKNTKIDLRKKYDIIQTL